MLRTRTVIAVLLIAVPVCAALIHSLAKFVVFCSLFVIKNGTDFDARFVLDCLKPRLGFFAKILKLMAGLLSDLVHLLSLRLIET